MKSKLLLFFVFQLFLWSCKSSSESKRDLIVENKILKERLTQFAVVDTSKTIGVLETKNLNVVYRGFNNPLAISVPNAVKVEASAPGLKKVDEFGNYNFVPLSGRNVDILILGVMPNNDTIYRTKTLRIKDVGKFTGTINDLGCGNKCEVLLTKEKLFKGKIDVKLYDMLFDWSYEVPSFKIHFPNGKSYTVEGNVIPTYLEKNINELKTGDRLIIFDIKLSISSRVPVKPPSPIIIKIVGD